MNKTTLQKELDFLQETLTSRAIEVDHPDDPVVPMTEEQPLQEDVAPFGGGTLLGIIVDPSTSEAREATGVDPFEFSNSRTFGCSSYQPWSEFCKGLTQDENAVTRMVGWEHINDRFLVERPVEISWSDSEFNILCNTRSHADKVFREGAMRPLVFIPVGITTPVGEQPVPHHYIVSPGFTSRDTLEIFERFMKSSAKEYLLRNTYERMEELYYKIQHHLAAPVRGYSKD